jgi:transcriptional regulator with XRE-family HTH domain
MSLKELRKSRGLSLRDVEAITHCRVSNAYLSQLENGKIKNPSLAIACDLAAAYGTSIEQVADLLRDAPALEPTPVCKTCGQAVIA